MTGTESGEVGKAQAKPFQDTGSQKGSGWQGTKDLQNEIQRDLKTMGQAQSLDKQQLDSLPHSQEERNFRFWRGRPRWTLKVGMLYCKQGHQLKIFTSGGEIPLYQPASPTWLPEANIQIYLCTTTQPPRAEDKQIPVHGNWSRDKITSQQEDVEPSMKQPGPCPVTNQPPPSPRCPVTTGKSGHVPKFSVHIVMLHS